MLLAGLSWRLALAFFVVPAWEAQAHVASTPDAYPLLARSLAEDGVLGYAPAGASPTTVRGPGFPLWLTLGFVVGGDGPRWLGFWGGLPGVLAGAWLAAACARRFGAAGGLVAGAVAVLHPLPSLVASRVMGDDFYGALGLAALALWVEALHADAERKSRLLTVACGLLLAAQMLARASGILTLLAAVGYALWRTPRKVALALLLAAVALLPPLVWSVRTSRLENRLVFVHSLAAYNFWIGEGFDRFGAGDPPAGNYSRIVQSALEEAGPDFADPRFWYASLSPVRSAQLEIRLARAARQRILGDPLGYLARVARGVPAFWFRGQTTRRTLEYTLAVAPLLLLGVLGIRGALADPLGRLLLCVLVAHNLAYAAVLPAARISVGVYPALAYLAGAGAAWAAGLIRPEPRR